MKRLLLTVVMCIVVSGAFVLPKTSHAEGGGWLTDALTGETETNPSPFAYYGDCTQKTVAMGMYYYPGIIEKRACVYEGKDYHYVFNDGFLYVALGDSQQYYMVNNIHFSSSGLILPSPETNDYIYNAQIITDVPSALTVEPWGQSKIYQHADAFMYNFAQDELGNLNYSVQGRGVSRNGEWFVARIRGVGIVRFNTKSKAALRISPDADGLSMLTVSNDGQYVAETLGSADFQPVIHAVNGCGQGAPLLQSSWHGSTLTNPCKSRFVSEALNTALGVGYSKVPEPPEFSDDGKQLIVYSYVNNQRVKVTLHGAGYELSQLDYLAMGDSYSSGEGDIDKDGFWYVNGTGDRDECHLSRRSYPYLLRDMWNIDQSKMKSVACSGAKVNPDYFGTDEYFGQRGDLKNKLEAQKQQVRNDALDSFTPSVVRQIDFVAKYKPKTLTLTAGGNDVGFGEILSYCATPKIEAPSAEGDVSCAQAYDPQVAANLRKTIDDERAPLTTLINKIREASPETKVYLIGYPQFISLDGCVRGSELLDRNERRMIRDSVSRLNNILKLVARDTDVYYVDIEDSLEGGQICQGSRYMTGPVRIAQKVLAGYSQEAYHPNANGHAKIADVIDERIKNDNLSYTIIEMPLEQNGQRVIKKAVTRDYVGVGSTQTVEMGPGTFDKDGTLDAGMFSRKIHLGTYKVASDGSLSAKITIPSELEPGIHLLTLTGKSVSGDIVQVQQYITVYNDPTNPDKMHDETNMQQIHALEPETFEKVAELNESKDQVTGTQLSGGESSMFDVDDLTAVGGGRSSNTQQDTGELYFYAAVLASAILVILGVSLIYAKKGQKRAK